MASVSSPVTWGDRGPSPLKTQEEQGRRGPRPARGPGLRGTLPLEGSIHLLPLCSLPEENARCCMYSGKFSTQLSKNSLGRRSPIPF